MNDINAVGASHDKSYYTPADLKKVHNIREIENNKKEMRSQSAKNAQQSLRELKKRLHREELEFDIEKLLEEIKKFNNGIADKEIKLSYNEEIDRVIITVINKHSHEIIAEYPCEELQHLARHLKEMIGIIFDKEA